MIRHLGLKKMSANAVPNMTPMVDIVLCILIFFMLSMEIAGAGKFLTSNLAPEKGNGISVGANYKVPPVTSKLEIKTDEQTHRTVVLAFGLQIVDLEGQLPELL